MNKQTFTIAATVVGSLFVVGSSNADFNGISFDETLTAYGTTFKVYADVDEGDQLNAIFGDSVDALTIGSDNGFYQNQFGSHKAPSSALFGFFPSLQYDSFVTIGLETDTGNNLLDIGVDWSIFEGNVMGGSHYDGENLETSNGSWFATPDDAQVYEVGGRVLLGQFTVEFGDHVYGVVNVQGKNADLSNWQYRGVAFDSAVVPAPGAIALLGLAGVCARRRRK